MKYILLISLLLMIGCQTDPCEELKEDFDSAMAKSKLPMMNPEALCYGLNMGSDFGTMEPRWVAATLIEKEEFSQTFKGNAMEGKFFLPEHISKDLRIGTTYRMDINNLCRSFFMMLDSRYPSPLNSTFTPLETCG